MNNRINMFQENSHHEFYLNAYLEMEISIHVEWQDPQIHLNTYLEREISIHVEWQYPLHNNTIYVEPISQLFCDGVCKLGLNEL